ncbi:hypothetical protein KG112_05765 [Nocardioides sp. zg-ZUI104]|uniref:hypothetical protein n=1 Tax=Nocardioides faecalis TaxID=2803858 RepID=UPI001BD1246E|nr:hypothetical protein [Nocardioides faecalis]MBS4752314.1 hypothetical protein [Nocardioides faecalis]
MTREDAGDQDAAWQQIVDNYGDRVLIDPVEETSGETAGHTDATPDRVEDLHLPDEPADPDETAVGDDLDEVDRFVPEEAPPVAMPPLDRLLAWAGVLGSPVVLLVFLLLGLSLPGLLAWVLVGGFIAGFCYLVARMPGGPRDPWDDGARV